jgi:uncharacterized protein
MTPLATPARRVHAVHVAVMAKQPLPGKAKTRLAPALGADGAARLAARLLAHALDQASRAAVGPVTLFLDPDAGHGPTQAAACALGVDVQPQGDGDLGERMERLLRAGLDRARAAIVMGTDAPGLDTHVLQAAAAGLARHDAVIVPALDGGFVLLGLTRCPPGLLHGLSWSHDAVLRQTRARLAGAGLDCLELPALADIDTPDDLRHLPSGLSARDD